MKNELCLGEISFYWRMKSALEDSNDGVPEFLPFSFHFNTSLGLLQQKYSCLVSETLESVYAKDENVGYLQDGHDLAELYSSDFLNFLEESLDLRAFKGKNLLEVGCGGCYLLNKLKSIGFKVFGCDPSPVSLVAGKKNNIDIVSEFYGGSVISSKFDMIVHYDVLEHIYDPIGFLKQHRVNLNTNGYIAFAVPDCTEAITRGDISMILHEHVNYFSASSLKSTVEASGFEIIALRKGDKVGTLHCVAKVSEKPFIKSRYDEVFDFNDFLGKFEINKETISTWLDIEDVGIYIPLRAIPYLCIDNRFSGIRFFDDNTDLHGKFFDGFNIDVESFDDLIRNPPKRILVFSYVFGELIRKKILSHAKCELEIFTLEDLEQ